MYQKHKTVNGFLGFVKVDFRRHHLALYVSTLHVVVLVLFTIAYIDLDCHVQRICKSLFQLAILSAKRSIFFDSFDFLRITATT